MNFFKERHICRYVVTIVEWRVTLISFLQSRISKENTFDGSGKQLIYTWRKIKNKTSTSINARSNMKQRFFRK